MTNSYVRLAYAAIKAFLERYEILEVPAGLPTDFYFRRTGVFVTIYGKNTPAAKELRGCIGTFIPQRKNLAEEIIHNAVAAATEDYRFAALTAKDLDSIFLEVSILSRPEPVEYLVDLDAARYGVIVGTGDGRRGLLLPAIEGVDTVNEQIAIACQKGAIDPERDKISLQRFTVEKYA